jgi:chain length determinant protein (polysaccharide antigen chain regulator)
MTQENKHTEERVREYLVLDPELIQRYGADDEISLLDLWAILFKKRILIFAIVAASLVISVAIAYLSTPVYQSTVQFRPPHYKDIEALDILSFISNSDSMSDSDTDTESKSKSKSNSVSAENDGFREFQTNLKARDNLWDFFIEKQLYKAYLDENGNTDAEIANAFENKFLKDMTTDQGNDKKEYITATLNWKDATAGSALLNEYSQAVIRKATDEYVDELNNKLNLMKKRVQTKIRLLRESRQRAKNDRLIELNENINIAKELGIKRGKGLVEWNTSDELIGIPGNQSQYYKGYEALEAEKRSLLARKNDDPFTPGLNEQLDQLDYLNTIRIPADRISVARAARQAMVSNQPIKPRKKLIVVIGGVFGLFLGVIMAFMSHVVSRQRAEFNKG